MAGATFVQGKSTSVLQNQQQISLQFDSAVPVDDWIGIGVVWQDTAAGASQTIDAVTGGAGNTYANGTLRTNSGGNLRAQLWWVKNVLNAAHTILVHFTAVVANRISLSIMSATGVHGSLTPIEAWGQLTATSALNAGDLTTLEPNSLLFSHIHTVANRTFTAPSPGFTLINTQALLAAGAYRSAEAVATYGATWGWSGGNTNAIGLHLAFRPATPATTPPTGITSTSLLPNAGTINYGVN